MKYNLKYLVDGKYSFKDLVDIDRLRVMLERLSQATGFTTCLTSYPDQELLIGAGWRDICKNFHRAVQDSEVHCKQSNLELTAGLKEPKMVNIHHCKNGLVGGATPIIIKAAHVANLFTGQVLFSKPDVERFRKQGEAYGYDVDAYLEALEKVPVIPEEAFEKALGFLSEIAIMLAEQGLNALRSREAFQASKESEENMRTILDSIGDAVIAADTQGNITRMNPVAEKLTGWTLEQARGKALTEVFNIVNAHTRKQAVNPVYKVIENGMMTGLANHSMLISKDGTEYQIADSASPIWDIAGNIIGVVLVFRDVTEEYRMHENLQESERRFKDLAELIPQPIWETDLEANFTYFNRTGFELFGCAQKDLEKGVKIVDLMATKDRKRILEDFSKKLKGEQFEDHEYMGLKKDGARFPILIYSSPIVRKGKLTGLRGITLDITERKQAEEALRQKSEEQKALLSTIPAFVYLKGCNGKYVAANKAFADMTGTSVNEIAGETDYDFFPEEEADFYRKCDQEVMESYEPKYNIEEPVTGADGKKMWVSTSKTPFFDSDGKVTGMVGITVDITGRKRTEEALRKSEERFRELANLLPQTVFETDERGNLTFANQVALDYFGYTQEGLDKGLNALQMVIPEHRDRAKENIARIMKGEKLGIVEHTALRKDGSTFPFIIHSNPIIHEKKPVGLRGILVDITERKKAEEELRKLQKIKSIGTLAGGLAHDFNNILMGLFGNISIAKMKLSENHPAFKPLEEAENSMNRATRLTRQLLTFAKGGEPVKEDVSIGALVKGTVRFDLSGSNVMPVFEQADDLWIAEVDKGQIQQVFSNLTINANQAMPDGGYLYISLENADMSEGVAPNLKQGKYIKVTVVDEGTGIDKRYLNQIFDPYFSTKQTGCGLGLATVYSIINKHGGYICVDSKPGKGTTFTLYLPVSESQQLPETKQPAAKVSTMEQTARILVMDDEEIVREVVTAMLENIGYSVETADSGNQAIEMYKQSMDAGQRFDVVIMDLTIPGGIGGKEAIKDILAIDSKARAIVSSGYADDRVMANYAEYGFKGIASKPYTISKLQEVLSQVLKK